MLSVLCVSESLVYIFAFNHYWLNFSTNMRHVFVFVTTKQQQQQNMDRPTNSSVQSLIRITLEQLLGHVYYFHSNTRYSNEKVNVKNVNKALYYIVCIFIVFFSLSILVAQRVRDVTIVTCATSSTRNFRSQFSPKQWWVNY